MIELKNLRLRLGDHLIFDNFNFKADKGDKIGIIGGEGSGKTTLLDVIAGREVPITGEVKITGRIVPIKRNMYSNFSELQFAEMTLAEKFKMTLTKALEKIQSDDKILLLDEPTRNLNTDEIEWLIDFLKSAKDLTVIVASNDRYFLKKICSKTVALGESSTQEIILPNVETLQNDEDVLTVENLFKTVDGEPVFSKVNFSIERGQKVALVGKNEVGKTKLLKVFGANIPVEGKYNFSESVKIAYMPRVFSSTAAKFELDKIRDSDANFLILDNPTICLALPMIIELENALKNFNGTVIFADSDHEFIQAVANRIIYITPNGTIDRISTYNDFLANETVKEQIEQKYNVD